MKEAKSRDPLGLLTSTIALKVAAALTGALLAGFVLFHMAGNLQVFLGRERYNDYAEFMQSLGELLWVARLGLLALLLGHIGSIVLLVRRNKTSRPEAYAKHTPKTSTVAGRYMFEAGLVLLLFIIYHLSHFTLGLVHNEQFDWVDATGRHDLYSHFVLSFQNPFIAGAYVVAMLALAMHLSHGVTSLFRTLGISAGRWKRPLDMVGPAFATIVFVGNVSMPLACLTGLIQPYGG
jgi:succinate dehydrogenase / fumarate reductase cytochrome b subunit